MKETTVTTTPIISVQTVRLIDVFVIAPFCFYVASYKTLPKLVRAGLVVLGATTAFYNGRNYLLNARKSENSNSA